MCFHGDILRRMGRRRKPIIFGLDKAMGYQRALHNPLIMMGFVPLPILPLPLFSQFQPNKKAA